MSSIFSGLEGFGLDSLKDLVIYEAKEKQEDMKEVKSKEVLQEDAERDAIFDKTFTCPVCDHEFKEKVVRTGKVKLLSQDSDLRPKYHLVDCLKYDAIVCPRCGYAALNRFFSFVMTSQAKAIKEKISVNFKGLDRTNEILTYEDAIARHKLVLVNTVVKKAKDSEKAYTCLKLAWLCRGKRETLQPEMEDYDREKKALKKEEKTFLKNAFEGFTTAFTKEGFPMCGMDEDTVTYLVADLAFKIEKFEDATKWLSTVLTSRGANPRLKEKARELKEQIFHAKS